MYGASIVLNASPATYVVGDTVSGTAEVTVPERLPLSNLSLSFHCRGEVKWIEVVDMLHMLQSHTYYEKEDYHEQRFNIVDNPTQVTLSEDKATKKVSIPFAFTVPEDQSLPSTMISSDGFVKYFIRLTITPVDGGEADIKKFYKEVIVLAPFDKNLMITVGGSVEKTVLLHGGPVAMHATIGRKGFAPGETITVHVTVDNQTNTRVVPQIALNQTQIFSSGIRLKVLENTLHDQPIVGTGVEPHSKAEEVLNVVVPHNESMSIKSSLITVKYFVKVTLDIPHSFNLTVNLPVVVTAQSVIDRLHTRKDSSPALLTK